MKTLEDLIAGCDVPSSDRTIVIGRDYDGWRQTGRPRPPRIRLNEWDVFALSYTAGTTGKPKGVMLSHRSRALTFYAMAVEYGCYSPDDRSLVLAPLFHGGGFAFGLAPIFFGGFSEILSKFDPETVLRKFDELSITNTFMVPTHFKCHLRARREDTREISGAEPAYDHFQCGPLAAGDQGKNC